ncbi:crystallin J1A-like [Lytechinus pictus]|uniref:crystallin J1A-like n=1 Tax=Lytechinus pictus TaxID=7653 RepID=UPI0030B9ED46
MAADGVINSSVIVALYGGTPQMIPKLEAMVKVVQNTPICLKFALTGARLLEDLIKNGPNANAVENLKSLVDADMAQEVSKAEDLKPHPHIVAAKKLGYACSLPGSFLGMLHCLLSATPGNFTESVRPTLLAGGDNCARAAMLGACLGAQVGIEGLPGDLLAQVERGEEVRALAQQLVDMRQA